MLRDIYIKIVMALKLIDLINESMADGGAFRAFVDNAVAKKEIQANEDIDDRITSVPGNGLGEGEEDEISHDDQYKINGSGLFFFNSSVNDKIKIEVLNWYNELSQRERDYINILRNEAREESEWDSQDNG
jgi:hypothetical protein